jgi:hypothetical protein
MSREFEVREQMCFVNGENCLNRLVLDDDALGHQRVDAITHFNLDPFIPDGQGNFAADLDTPATKFMGEARLIRRLQQAGPQCSVHLEHGVHHALGNLLDLFLCLIRLLFPSRSLRLRGAKWYVVATRQRRSRKSLVATGCVSSAKPGILEFGKGNPHGQDAG